MGWFINFLQKPWVALILVLFVSAFLLAQCIMTMLVVDSNPSEKSKQELRSVTIATLVITVLLVIYAFMKLACKLPLVGSTVVCKFF